MPFRHLQNFNILALNIRYQVISIYYAKPQKFLYAFCDRVPHIFSTDTPMGDAVGGINDQVNDIKSDTQRLEDLVTDISNKVSELTQGMFQ